MCAINTQNSTEPLANCVINGNKTPTCVYLSFYGYPILLVFSIVRTYLVSNIRRKATFQHIDPWPESITS